MSFNFAKLDIDMEAAVNDLLVNEAVNSTRDYTYFHPSEWDECHRKIAYRYYQAKGYITIEDERHTIDPVLERIFGAGHYMHDRWRDYFTRIGILRGRWICFSCLYKHGTDEKLGILKPDQCSHCKGNRLIYSEVGVKDEVTNWYGHFDAICDLRKTKNKGDFNGETDPLKCHLLVDFKTINPFQYDKLDSPIPKHIVQIQIYLYLTGLYAGKLIYENKGNQRVKQFFIQRDDDFILRNVDEAKTLKYIVENTNSKGLRVLPQRPYKNHSNNECLGCEFRGNCWPK